MRKMIQLLCIAFVITIIGLTGLMPSSKVEADNTECLSRMSEETATYIRDMKISLKGRDAEFYSNKGEQVYLLNSEEPLKLNSRRPITNTVAVVNHQDANGKRDFYVIEQEITRDKIIYALKKDSKVLQTLPIRMGSPARLKVGGPGNPSGCQCDAINAETNAQLAGLVTLANQTCKKQGVCLPVCHCFGGVQSIAQTLFAANPTSWNCRKFTEVKFIASSLWGRVSEESGTGTLLDHAFEVAIKKEALLYSF
ncbi:MAG TPA: hypothetical protein VF666_13165 [Pyrinomonadaceae bacterium]|jgi:hypothetical protein